MVLHASEVTGYTFHRLSQARSDGTEMTIETVSARDGSDALFYILAALAGIGIGWVDVVVNDLLFTALLVLAACMLFGMLRPHWPWRWVVAMVIFIPVAELAGYLVMTVKPTRGQVYGSFLTALPGVAGAYGGAVMRAVVENWRKKQ